jgi:hypothetical protein
MCRLANLCSTSRFRFVEIFLPKKRITYNLWLQKGSLIFNRLACPDTIGFGWWSKFTKAIYLMFINKVNNWTWFDPILIFYDVIIRLDCVYCLHFFFCYFLFLFTEIIFEDFFFLMRLMMGFFLYLLVILLEILLWWWFEIDDAIEWVVYETSLVVFDPITYLKKIFLNTRLVFFPFRSKCYCPLIHFWMDFH